MSVARNGSHLSNRPAKLRPTLLSPVPSFFPLVLRLMRQEEPAILISRLLLRMRRMYAASIRLDFH